MKDHTKKSHDELSPELREELTKKINDNLMLKEKKKTLKLKLKQDIKKTKKDSKQNTKETIFKLKYDYIEETASLSKKYAKRATKFKLKMLKKENLQKIKQEYLLKKQAEKEFNDKLPKPYTVQEEILNSITHGIGTGLAIAATVLLIVRAVTNIPVDSRTISVVGVSIFGASMIILYLMSTLYHALTPYGVKKVFAIFDHCSIYFLIAGTYTPFCFMVLHGPLGWTLFGIIWGLALIGITLYAIFGKRMKIASVITYVLMGWMIVLAFSPMKKGLPHESIAFLLAGGAAYTAGVAFYVMKKVKFTHAIWHLFVLFGTILHFFSVYYSI